MVDQSVKLSRLDLTVRMIHRLSKFITESPQTFLRLAKLSSRYRKKTKNPILLAWEVLAARPRYCNAKLKNGMHFTFRNTRGEIFLFNEIFISEAYNPCIPETNVDTVVDIGANIGAFTTLIAPTANRVIAIEPNPDCVELLRLNIEKNELQHKVHLHQAAVWDRLGHAVLNINPQSTPTSTLIPQPEIAQTRQIIVETTTIDELFQRYSISSCDLLKMDIEGSEFEVLLGKTVDALSRVKRMIIEVHRRESDFYSLSLIEDRLKYFGFYTQRYAEKDPCGVPIGHGYSLLLAMKQNP